MKHGPWVSLPLGLAALAALAVVGGSSFETSEGQTGRFVPGGRSISADGGSCTDALRRECGTVGHPTACEVCAGRRQRELKVSGCSDAAVRAFCASAASCVVYVSSLNGSDACSGTAPSAPLATIAAALKVKNALRRATPSQRCVIYVAGTHRLNGTLDLWKIDGRTALSAWQGAGPVQPTISGGATVPAASWRQSSRGGWQANISTLLRTASIDPASDWQPASIFVDGQRRQRVRTPILRWDKPLASDATQAGKDTSRWGFVYAENDIADEWDTSAAALKLWRVVAFHQWTKSYHTVRAVFRTNRTILFHQPAPFYYGQFFKNTASGKRYYIEGAAELPLQRGSHAFRLRPGGLLEYSDYDPLQQQEVVVPLLQRLLSLNHAPSVQISGLRLLHTTIQCPANPVDHAVAGGGGGGGGYTTCDDEFTGPKLSASTGGAAAGELLFANNCSGLELYNLTASHSGGNALSVSTSLEALIEHSLVTDAGGVGIEVSESFRGQIVNSRVLGAGKVIQNLPGITIHDSPYGVVTRCETSEVAHCRGIRFDSSADSGRYTNISWNHVHHCGCSGEECLSDGGGLDGMNTNSKLPVYIEHNWVHDIDAHHFGGAGIYADVSSNAMHITSNVVHDVADQVLYWNVQPGGEVPLRLDAEPFVGTYSVSMSGLAGGL